MMTEQDTSEGRQPRRQARWSRREGVLFAIGFGGTLAGFVSLIPFVSPKLAEIQRYATVGVFGLTIALVICAYWGGIPAETLYIEKLRLEMIRRRRKLLRWEERFTTASMNSGFLSAFTPEQQTIIRRSSRWKFRCFDADLLLLKIRAGHFDDEWLKYHTARNRYRTQTLRAPEPVVETTGIVMRQSFDREIGRLMGVREGIKLLAYPDDLQDLQQSLIQTADASIKLQRAKKAQDPFNRLLELTENDTNHDDGGYWEQSLAQAFGSFATARRLSDWKSEFEDIKNSPDPDNNAQQVRPTD